MNYESISEQNRFLYGALESLTSQISFIKANCIDSDTDSLEKRKDGIRELISINLDKLEAIWDAEAVSYRTSNVNDDELIIPSDKELRVIKRYEENPNQSIATLACEVSINRDHVSRIITKYLTQKYNLIPA